MRTQVLFFGSSDMNDFAILIAMNFVFEGEMWEWRGPAPFFFISLPESIAQEINEQAATLTYGWGMIPVTASIGKTKFETSMFRKDGTYVLPIKNMVRIPEKMSLGNRYLINIELS